MDIYVMSKGEIENISIPKNTIVINFYDKTGLSLFDSQKNNFAKNTSIVEAYKENRIFSICANDLDINSKKVYPQPVSILNKEVAIDLLKFILENSNNNFIFQCDYGISRSLTTAVYFYENILINHTFKYREKVIRNKSFYELFVSSYEL